MSFREHPKKTIQFAELSCSQIVCFLPYFLKKSGPRAGPGYFLPPNRSHVHSPPSVLPGDKRGVIPNLAGQTPR